MTTAHGFAALKPGGFFESIDYELPVLGPDDVKIDVESCGICQPVTEVYAMNEINVAFEKLRNGSPRYRLVLTR